MAKRDVFARLKGKEQPTSLNALLQDRVQTHADKDLYTFVDSAGEDAGTLTWAQLERQARALGAQLQHAGSRDKTVLLLCPPGLEYIVGFWGSLYGGAICVPAYPPHPKAAARLLPRLQAIVGDCNPVVALSVSPIIAQAEQNPLLAQGLSHLKWIALDKLDLAMADRWEDPNSNSDTLAFLQYTSGSTATPKGVKVSHGNLVQNMKASFAALRGNSTFVSWLPPFHDMGLIGGILQPAYGAGWGYYMAPATFLREPFRWLQALSKTGAAVSPAPNFAYDLCTARITEEQRAQLDLGSWTHAMSGAEPIRIQTIDRFAKRFAPVGFKRRAFHPCYGLAEATLQVLGWGTQHGPIAKTVHSRKLEQGTAATANPKKDHYHTTLVSSGKPINDTRVEIVDPVTRTPLGRNQVGELWVHAPGVAGGYWNRPDATEETFHATLAVPNDNTVFMRTGDLAFFDGRGEYFITGRIKDVIISRGRNIYPQDLEIVAEKAHPSLRRGCVAAFGVDVDGCEEVAIAQEFDSKSTDPKDIEQQAHQAISAIRQSLSADSTGVTPYAIVLIKRGTIPKTTSGKIQRQAARKAFMANKLQVVAQSVLGTPATTIAAATTETATAAGTAANDDQPKPKDAKTIQEWMLQAVTKQLGLPPQTLNGKSSFGDVGLDSYNAVALTQELSAFLGCAVPSTLVWEHPTFEAAANFLAELANTAPAKPQSELSRNTAPRQSSPENDPIAIVGMGCRFPGAADPQAFWQLLCEGRDAIVDLPQGRWSQTDLPTTTKDGRQVNTWGGYLDSIDKFEPQMFGLSHREAQRIDPQQRLLLEVAWEALEQAGINPKSLAKSNTGVFTSISNNEYWTEQLAHPSDLDIHACTGSAHAVAANRISYTLDLRGPSVAVDTACSGSLVSVHMACESLRQGDSKLAIAGGVNLMVTPHLTYAFSQARMLSEQGACRVFDDDADGYVRGEGCGLVVLERLSDAIANGHPVIAVISGSAVQQDGRSNGLTAPNAEAQHAVIERALHKSGVAARDVAYVEAHGTGTPLGDPIEVRTLAATYGAQHNNDRPCMIGSVKANIGHLEAAAGIAGLIKTALILQHNAIPPQVHLATPNRRVDWQGSGLQINTQATSLAIETKRSQDTSENSGGTNNNKPTHAAISSFGFGGTIAHAILASAPLPEVGQAAVTNTQDNRWQLLPLAARTTESLQTGNARIAKHLKYHAEVSLQDVCFTAALGRAPLEQREAFVGNTREAMLQSLSQNAPEAYGNPQQSIKKIAFCYTGQGSQYAGMARGLITNEPVFAGIVDRCDALARPVLRLSLKRLLTDQESEPSQLRDTAVQQPLLYTLQAALTELWRHWGIHPHAVMGHSIGEYAAAYAAGMLSLEDGLALVLTRGQAMAKQPGNGGMAAFLGDAGVVRRLLANHEGKLWAAAYNTPTNTVVAGDVKALAELAAQTAAQGIDVKPLAVSHAFHTPMVAQAARAVAKAARSIALQAPKCVFISNLGGQSWQPGDAPPTTKHFARHLEAPVDFYKSIQASEQEDITSYLELGGGQTLMSLGRTCHKNSAQVQWLPSLLPQQPNQQVLLTSLAKLWCAGHEVDWQAFYAQRSPKPKRVAMPTYAFHRSRHWLSAPAQAAPGRLPARPTQMPGNHNHIPSNPGSVRAFLSSAVTALNAQTQAIQALSQNLTAATPAVAGSRTLDALRVATAPALPTGGTNERNQDILTTLKTQVARITGTPQTQLSLHARLGSELGLDSLMRVELNNQLAKLWPNLVNQLDASKLPEDPTIADVATWLGYNAPDTNQVNETSETSETRQEPTTVQPEARFQDSQEYQQLQQRLATISKLGVNPYGRIHQGTNADQATVDGRKVLNFASFNYCSLSNHPRVCAAAKQAVETYGTSPSATPLLFGETPLHHQLEQEIASFMGTDAAIVFASGHGTSVAVIGHLMDTPDLVIHDELIHDCAIRGAILSGARRRSFRHDDFEHLDQILSQVRHQFRRVLIIIEGVYSQDGDVGSLPAFVRVKKKHNCMLMIDEAHSIGVLGKTGAGAGEHFGVNREDVDLWMGTLSKGLGSCGGYIAGSQDLITYLKFTTPLFIFSTGITPANAAAALEAIRVLRDDPSRVKRLQEKAARFLKQARELGLDTGVSQDSPVIPIIVGNWEKAIALSNELLAQGINVMPIGYPAVPRDKCRLRFFINVDHDENELRRALFTLAKALKGYGATTQCNIQPIRTSQVMTATNDSAGRTGRHTDNQDSTQANWQVDALVTGATGFIGSHLIRNLTQQGKKVRALVRPGRDTSALESLGNVEIAYGSLEDAQSLSKAAHGAKVIYNCAGLSADWGPQSHFSNANIVGVQNLLNALERAGNQRLVHLSTSDVYGYPTKACDESVSIRNIGLPYNQSKVEGENIIWDAVANKRLPVTVLRPVTVYGPGAKDWVIEVGKLMQKKQMLLIDGGNTPAGLVYVDNLTQAMQKAAESPAAIGRAYNIRDEGNQTWSEYVKALGPGLPNGKWGSIKVKSSIALRLAKTMEKVYGGLRVGSRPLLTQHAVYLLSRDQGFDIERAKEDLNFESTVSFDEGMRRTRDWLGSKEGQEALA